MARLFSSGFELQSVTALVEFDTVVGSPTINTTTKRSGAASLRANPTAATAYLSKQVQAAAGTNYTYSRFYLNIATAPAGLTAIYKLSEDTTVGGGGVSVRLNNNRTLEFWDDSDSLQLGSDSSALATGTWYRIEVQMGNDGVSASARIDGTQFATGSMGGIVDSPQTIFLGVQTSATCDLYFDDYAFNDVAGTVQNSWPGAGSIVHIKPNATGDNSGGTYTGAATGWDTLNEVTPDDATTFTSLTVANSQILDVNCESSSTAGIGSSDTVTLVQVGMRLSATTAAACAVTPRLKSAASGTTTAGTSTSVNVTAWHTNDDTAPRNYKLTSYTDPTTTVAWTPTGTNSLDNMQIGILSADVTPNPRVSTLWALVEYVPAANTAPTVVLNTTDTLVTSDTTPTLEFTGTDTESNDIRYNVQIDTSSDFGAATPNVENLNNDNSYYSLQGGTNTSGEINQARAQSFTVPINSTVNSVNLRLKKAGSPTGTLTADIVSSLTGSSLAQATIAESTLTTSSAAYLLTFTTPVALVTGTTYYIRLTTSRAWSGTVYIDIEASSTNYANGSAFTRVDNSWNGGGGTDFYFILAFANQPPLLDKVSNTDAGFLNTVNGGDTDPFTSGQMVSYTVQSALTAGTYYWRARGLDPSGTNTYGAWATTRTFTIGNISYTPNFFYFT